MWHLADHQARVRVRQLECGIDLLHPAVGLSDVRLSQMTWQHAQLLAVRLPGDNFAQPEVLLDCYTRGSDLVATYAQTPERTVRPQVYWRILPDLHDELAAGIELIISMQTSLLDSTPCLNVASCMPAQHVLRLMDERHAHFEPVHVPEAASLTLESDQGTSLLLFRPSAQKFSYAEMVFPGDFTGAILTSRPGGSPGDPVLQITRQFFPEPLEKGVIRRARMCGIFFSRLGDEHTALQYYRDWIASPPPLTT